MKRKIITIFVVFLLYFFWIPRTESAHAAFFKLEPQSFEATASSSFNINVDIDSDSEQIVGTDIYILYDENLMSVTSVNEGEFFPTFHSDTQTAGRVYISASVQELSQAKSGTGTVAQLTFNPLSTGNTALSFDCTEGSTTDSNILKNDANATDIIVCADNVGSTISISGSSQPTPTVTAIPTVTPTSTPIPTVTPTSLATPTPRQLPRTGAVDEMLKYLVLGGGFTSIGFLLKRKISV